MAARELAELKDELVQLRSAYSELVSYVANLATGFNEHSAAISKLKRHLQKHGTLNDDDDDDATAAAPGDALEDDAAGPSSRRRTTGAITAAAAAKRSLADAPDVGLQFAHGIKLTDVVGHLNDVQRHSLVEFLPQKLTTAMIDNLATKTQGRFNDVLQSTVVDVQRRLVPGVGYGKMPGRPKKDIVPPPPITEDVIQAVRDELILMNTMRPIPYTHLRVAEHLPSWLRHTAAQNWTVMELIQGYASVVNRLTRFIYKRKITAIAAKTAAGTSSGQIPTPGSHSPHEDSMDMSMEQDISEQHLQASSSNGGQGSWPGIKPDPTIAEFDAFIAHDGGTVQYDDGFDEFIDTDQQTLDTNTLQQWIQK
eukprot:jgi/Hompol1/4731/HPOL_003854-RA